MAASLSMALGAQGSFHDEDTVNKVMGAKPMKGASWEQALAACQHFGMRATLITPCSMKQLREWTDRGVAVMIAWNPEGRDWSHASVVFDVTDTEVSVADPNIPDPEQTVRTLPREEFLKKWFEAWPDYLVRRPALAVEREITMDGRQVQAGRVVMATRVAARFLKKAMEGKIRPFDSGDWSTFAGAEDFEDGPPLIVDFEITDRFPDGFRKDGKVFTHVSFISFPEGVKAYFTNLQGDEAIAQDTQTLRYQRDGYKRLKYVAYNFKNRGTLTPMFKWM